MKQENYSFNQKKNTPHPSTGNQNRKNIPETRKTHASTYSKTGKSIPKTAKLLFQTGKNVISTEKTRHTPGLFPKLEKHSRNRQIVISTEKHATPSTGNLCLKLDLWCSKYSSMQIVIGIAYTIEK